MVEGVTEAWRGDARPVLQHWSGRTLADAGGLATALKNAVLAIDGREGEGEGGGRREEEEALQVAVRVRMRVHVREGVQAHMCCQRCMPVFVLCECACECIRVRASGCASARASAHAGKRAGSHVLSEVRASVRAVQVHKRESVRVRACRAMMGPDSPWCREAPCGACLCGRAEEGGRRMAALAL